MEASQGNVRGVIDTLIKVVEALNAAGIELLGDNAKSDGWRARRSPQGAGGDRPPRRHGVSLSHQEGAGAGALVT